MREFIDVTGKTEEEAIQNALRQLGLDRDDVSVEILERAKSGFLGLGSWKINRDVEPGGGRGGARRPRFGASGGAAGGTPQASQSGEKAPPGAQAGRDACSSR